MIKYVYFISVFYSHIWLNTLKKKSDLTTSTTNKNY